MGKRLTLGASAVAAALLFGCSHTQEAKAPNINEDWLSRVPPGEMAPVERSRANLRSAQDDLNRAEAGVRDAENQESIAKSEKDTADNRVETAQKALKAARNTGDESRINEAQSNLTVMEAERTAAESKVEWASANVDAAKSRKDLAEARVRTQEAKVNQAEYEALARTNDTRVQKYSPAQFQAEVDMREREETQYQQKIRDTDMRATAARDRWNDARQRLEASRRGRPAG